MLRLLCALGLLVVVILAPADARACGGAVLREIDDSASRLHEAEQALDTGDVRYARALAAEVLDGAGSSVFHDRAHRIEAVALARDPHASTAELARAADVLEIIRQNPETRSPSVDADWAETAGRVPQKKDEARRVLASLADRDLMGSPHAYAALARLADERGDRTGAGAARARCRAIAQSPDICRAELPRPPLRLHGHPAGYAVPAAIAALGLVLRAVRRRRDEGRGLAPWIDFGARAQVAAVALAGVWTLARARSPIEVSIVMLVVVVLSLVLERRLFLRAVRAGRIPGFALRATVPEDASIPTLRLHLGPKAPETLERVAEDAPDGGYRLPARAPLLRAARRPLARTVGLGFACVILVMVASGMYKASRYRHADVDDDALSPRTMRE